MKNLSYGLAALVALFVWSCAPSAQAQQQSSGAYTMYLGEQPAGDESYVLTTNADGSRRSEAEVGLGLNKSKVVTVVNAAGKPVSIAVEMGGVQALAAEFADGKVKVNAPGQPAREVKTQATVIIENAVWHHFIFMLAQYDAARGGQQTFVAFLPTQALEFSLQVERVGTPVITVKGQQVATEHYRAVTSQGLVFEVWADPTRTPLLILIPAQGVKVVRTGAEALAETLTARPAAPADANAPYTSEEVAFQNGDVKLAGTLTVPKKGSAPFPAAVIITGSGGQDRDGSMLLNLYRKIAEHLSASGVAVLRVDDRGTGKSVMPKMTATSYRDLVNDTRAAFDFLQTRNEIDKKRVALVGHSEGAQTALVIAAEDARVAGVALLAGTSRPVDHIVYEQALYMIALQETVDPSDMGKLPQISRDMLKIFETLKTEAKPANPADDKYAWFREHAASKPSELARRVRVPVLILNGERDSQVLPYHALELAQALGAGGNKSVRLRIFPNLTHLFTPSTLDRSASGENSSEVSTQMLQTLQQWFASAFK